MFDQFHFQGRKSLFLFQEAMSQFEILDLDFKEHKVILKRGDETLWSAQTPDDIFEKTDSYNENDGSAFFDVIADKVLELAPMCDVLLFWLYPECNARMIHAMQI